MPQVSKKGNAVYLEAGIWYDAEQDMIHLTVKDVPGFHTTVNREPGNMRGHPNLFAKLAGVLKEHGAPAPEIIPKDKDAA